MALLWYDHFDSYNTSQLSTWWNFVGNATSIAAAGRTGANCLRTTFNNGSGVMRNLPVATDVIYLATAIKITNLSFGFGAPIVCFQEIDTTRHVTLVLNGVGYINAYRGGFGGGTLLGTSGPAFAFLVGTWYYMEVKVKVANAPDGTIEVRINNTVVMSLAGIDTRNAGAAGEVSVLNLGNDFQTSQFGCSADWDDLMCYDDNAGSEPSDFKGDVGLYYLPPTAPGNYTQWTPFPGAPNWGNVDEVPYDGDTSYNSSATPTQRDSFGMTNAPVATGTVIGVGVDAVARKDEPGTREIALFTRLAGTDDDGATVALGTSYVGYREFFPLDPGGGAWSLADVNGMENGYLEVT